MRDNFISSNDTGETCIMRGSDTDDIIRELFRSVLRNYQEEF